MELTETGRVVYERTYSRTLPNGQKETWPETVERVVDGNLGFVDKRYQLPNEREDLLRMIEEFKIIPAGRHLWATGVNSNGTHLMNCWVSGWGSKPSEHFSFSFLRLMEGGGVGSNYSNRLIQDAYGTIPVQNLQHVHIVCDPEHQDYEAMKEAGVLSEQYNSEWYGAFVVEDSREGWAAALVDLVDNGFHEFLHHRDRVYDVSRVRHAGARLKTFGGTASGPSSLARLLIRTAEVLNDIYKRDNGREDNPFAFGYLTGIDAMEIDHAIAECVVSGGVRRSARMAMMHWDDKQIHEFINIKQDSSGHWTTNISVVVDDLFWHFINNIDIDSALCARAHDVLDALGNGAARNGEPGMWDWSLSQVGEPNPVNCTNPCGEITLEDWEPCNLGHINLAAFVYEDGDVDYDGLALAHKLMTRFLIRATFTDVADPKSREVLDRNRRIGVGHTGVASFLAMRGIKYSRTKFHNFDIFLEHYGKKVDEAALEFCHQLRIPVPVKKRTVAPTGTISKLCGVSEGIHPIFAKYFIRRIRFNSVSEDQMKLVNEYKQKGYNVVDDKYDKSAVVVEIPTKDTLVEAVGRIGFDEAVVEDASELTLDQLLNMQELYQTYWADNAVSFTANIDPDKYDGEAIANALKARAGKLKGSTVLPEGSWELAPYERMTKEEYEAYEYHEIADGVDENCATGACPIR